MPEQDSITPSQDAMEIIYPASGWNKDGGIYMVGSCDDNNIVPIASAVD